MHLPFVDDVPLGRRGLAGIAALALVAPAATSLGHSSSDVDPQTTAWVSGQLPRIGAGPAPAVRRVLADARRSGPLRQVLGGARVRVAAAGQLRDGSRVLGATVLLELRSARRNVAATSRDTCPWPGAAGRTSGSRYRCAPPSCGRCSSTSTSARGA